MKETPAFRPRPLILIILDGFGYREEKDSNAVAAATKPCWDKLWATCPHTTISGSGRCVGLPPDQMGNSEVGHMNMGAGRVVYQDLTRIDLAIESNEFSKNQHLLEAFHQASFQKTSLHILGLLSPGGVHSHEQHFYALLKMAKDLQFNQLFFHCFLDGRDTPPKSALQSIEALQQKCAEVQLGKIASIIGRFYAMDRDKRYERTEACYDLLTGSSYRYSAPTAQEALALAYARNETDEFVSGTIIHANDEPPHFIKEDDTVIFMNFRSDRARQLTDAFISADFDAFNRKKYLAKLKFLTLTNYDARFNVPTIFRQEKLSNLFGDYISLFNLKQLRIAETEKYAHVTFFFNGGNETPAPLEDRLLIPSPKVTTYDLQPEMSAEQLTAQLVTAIENQQYDVIICNFANPDMVGHTGNFTATVKAIETVDKCLNSIIGSVNKFGGEVLITADHGNAELMFDNKTGQPHTAHTSDPVPFIYVGRPAKIADFPGRLSDIAPTMLYLLNLPIPAEMTGRSLLILSSS